MKIKYDYILIDDDELVRMTWEFNAQIRKHNFKAYSNAKDLELDLVNIDVETVLYIDSNLGKDEDGQEVKGEILAQKIFKQGFLKIYLATGYNPEAFNHIQFIKGIINKEPPKEL